MIRVKGFTYLWIMLFVCIFNYNGLNGQNPRIDSLIALLDTEISDTLRFDIYSDVIWANVRVNSDLATALNDDYYRLAEQYKSERHLSFSQYYYAAIYKNKGDYHKAEPYMDSFLVRAYSIDDSISIYTGAFQKAIIQKGLEKFDSALYWLNESNTYAHSLGRMKAVANGLNSKGTVYRQLNLPQKAIKTFNESLGLCRSYNDTLGMANAHSNLGNTYADLGINDTALYHYHQQTLLDSLLNYDWGLGYAYENLGKFYNKLSQPEQALTYLERSLEIREKLGHQENTIATLYELASTQLTLSLNQQAGQNAQRAFTLSREFLLKDKIREGHYLLSKIAEKKGNYAEAYQQLKTYESIKDSLMNETIAQQALKIDAQTDYEKKLQEKEINILANQNILSELKLKQSRRILFLSVLAIGLLGALSFWLFQSRTKIKQLFAEVNTQKEVISSALSEKEFLIKEIHHRVKNNLQIISSLLKLQSISVNDKKAQEALQEGRNRVRSMALIHQNLYKDDSDLSTINMIVYIDQLIDEIADTYGMSDRILLNCAIDNIQLDVESAVPIGLIVNELVSNSFKHAFVDIEEPTIEIILKEENNKLFLSVSDNGIGFNATLDSEKGFGLKLIDAFAHRLGATIEADTKQGFRTTISIFRYKKQ